MSRGITLHSTAGHAIWNLLEYPVLELRVLSMLVWQNRLCVCSSCFHCIGSVMCWSSTLTIHTAQCQTYKDAMCINDLSFIAVLTVLLGV